MERIADISKYAISVNPAQESNSSNWEKIILPDVVSDLKFPGKIIISLASTDTKKLKFQNCTFENLSIKNEDKSLLNEIELVDCRIDSISFYDSCMDLKIVSSQIQSVLIDYCNLSSYRIDNSTIPTITLLNSCCIKEITIADRSEIKILDSKDADIDNITIHSSVVNKIRTNKQVSKLELHEGSVLDYLSINKKEELLNFLRTLEQKRKQTRKGTVSQMAVELSYQRRIILAAYNQYAEDNKFQEMDACLIVLRKINCVLARVSTKNLSKKLVQVIKYLVLGKMFGWGVKIVNPLITSAVIMLCFACVYCVALINMKMGFWECVCSSAVSSVFKFFSVNEVHVITILEPLENVEQIIGVIFLTIFTGIVARKIIR